MKFIVSRLYLYSISLYSFNCQSYEKIMVQAQKMAKKLVYSQGKVYFRGEFK